MPASLPLTTTCADCPAVFWSLVRRMVTPRFAGSVFTLKLPEADAVLDPAAQRHAAVDRVDLDAEADRLGGGPDLVGQGRVVVIAFVHRAEIGLRAVVDVPVLLTTARRAGVDAVGLPRAEL